MAHRGTSLSLRAAAALALLRLPACAGPAAVSTMPSVILGHSNVHLFFSPFYVTLFSRPPVARVRGALAILVDTSGPLKITAAFRSTPPSGSALTLKDLPTDAIERIGSLMNPLQRRSLGQAITNETGKNYLLGQKQQIHDFAAQKIQSFMNAPVIQNTLTRVPAVIRPHVYSVKPSGEFLKPTAHCPNGTRQFGHGRAFCTASSCPLRADPDRGRASRLHRYIFLKLFFTDIYF
eukprot:SAG22_NODE_3232_length_1842_cov_4.887550_1_plen_235_part_00